MVVAVDVLLTDIVLAATVADCTVGVDLPVQVVMLLSQYSRKSCRSRQLVHSRYNIASITKIEQVLALKVVLWAKTKALPGISGAQITVEANDILGDICAYCSLTARKFAM